MVMVVEEVVVVEVEVMDSDVKYLPVVMVVITEEKMEEVEVLLGGTLTH